MNTLSLKGVSRRFGAVQALDAVDLTVTSGNVHALMGENGAGKSTLIHLLAGLDRPDGGQMTLNGTPIATGSPSAVRAAGLRFIHQELHAVPGLSVAENMHLDHPYPRRFGLVDWRALNATAEKALRRLGLTHVDPRRPMSELGHGDQMLVRIASTLIAGGEAQAWLYVMDEPTAALTRSESERLFSVIGELVNQGAGVLYVSHRLGEVLRLADTVTVLRDGRRISTCAIADTDEDRIIHEMTGRDLSALFPPREVTAPETEIVLSVDGVRAGAIKDASFTLAAGEILGVAGLAGSGRGALLRILLGEITRDAGRVELAGQTLARNPAGVWSQGVAYVPRERRSEGLMLRRPVSENVVLPHLSRLARHHCFIDHARQKTLTRTLGEQVRLRSTSVKQPCQTLSGGNQQKVLFARALAGTARVLLLDEPTRGVDIGARYDIYRLIRGLSGAGVAVILASSDLPELLGLSDRIAVMRDGRLAETLEAGGLTEEALLRRFYHQQDTAA